LGFDTPVNAIGIFTFIDGKWILTSIKPAAWGLDNVQI
jgi:hypothetical protein